MGKRDDLAFFIKCDLFLVVTLSGDATKTTYSIKETLENASQDLTLEKLIYFFLDHLILKNNSALETIEINLAKLETSSTKGAQIQFDINAKIGETK